MSQITTGIRSILNVSAVYDLMQNVVGARKNRQTFVETFVRPSVGDVILDVGCGTGDILESLPEVAYYGCDISQDYIDTAKQRFGARGTFFCQPLNAELIAALPALDRVIMHGVMHHMSDDLVLEVMFLAKSGLKPGGRFVTVDPSFTDDQSRVARYLISRDRGQCVRTPAGYLALAKKVFPESEVVVRHDLNRIPYTHAILSCVR
ncbi:MAG: class I SAM-dependent methyltransferase [bacterium]|nr:class I SAM-dependent methyltransferase [Candidatus Kapabacteria bacterium]